ncbi:CdaR family transcriptional regulator [Camelliibacillus cellulosilyticus]|uniref:CdaR family transcriptional regulator n=1 Tax=Camelliibacillus cellulosilyticus TaxID=2174486 RepID=A0ABV9GLU6_9BACL
MKLNSELAQKIVKEARSSVDEHFIIVDTNCRIIASSEPGRAGDFHEGAKLAIAEDRVVYIQKEDAGRLQGVKPGINMPIKHGGEIIGVIGITGNPQDVKPFADLIRRLTELFIREAVNAERLASDIRGIEAFVYEWVHRDTLDAAFMERGDILGIDVNKSYTVVIAQVLGFAQKTDLLSNMVEGFFRFFSRKRDRVVRWGHDRFLFLIQDVSTIQLMGLKTHLFEQDEIDINVGVSARARSGLIREGFEEAQKALNAATPQQPVVFYPSLGIDLIIQEIPPRTRQAFLKNSVGDLEAELLETIRAYLDADCSVSRAAHRLHLHVNTLHYRLKKIKEITGLDLHATEGIATAYLALKLQESRWHG